MKSFCLRCYEVFPGDHDFCPACRVILLIGKQDHVQAEFRRAVRKGSEYGDWKCHQQQDAALVKGEGR